MREMDTALYRSTDLANRIDELIASPTEDAEPDARSFRFERLDAAPHRPTEDVASLGSPEETGNCSPVLGG